MRQGGCRWQNHTIFLIWILWWLWLQIWSVQSGPACIEANPSLGSYIYLSYALDPITYMKRPAWPHRKHAWKICHLHVHVSCMHLCMTLASVDFELQAMVPPLTTCQKANHQFDEIRCNICTVCGQCTGNGPLCHESKSTDRTPGMWVHGISGYLS